MKIRLVELLTSQHWITILALFLLLSLTVFVLIKKYLIPAIFLKFYPGVIVKKRKRSLKPIRWSNGLAYIFKGVKKFEDVSVNLTDHDILDPGTDKRFCLLKREKVYYLANLSITRFQFFGFRYLIALPDISHLIPKLAQSVHPIVITDHKGQALYSSSRYKAGFFFPSDLLGNHPAEDEWDYLAIVKGNWAKTCFASRDLKWYWVTRPLKIDDVPLIIWHAYKADDIRKEIDDLLFPAYIDGFGHSLENRLKKEWGNGSIEEGSPITTKMAWHFMNVSLPLNYAFTFSEDRLSTQSLQVEAMIKKVLDIRHPDPDSFVKFHLAEIINVLYPLYLKITQENRVIKETGEFRKFDPKTITMGNSGRIHDYHFADQSGEVKIQLQLGYPLTRPVKAFLKLCFFTILPLLRDAAGAKDDRMQKETAASIRKMRQEIDDMQKGLALFHERLYQNLNDLNRQTGSLSAEEAPSRQLLEILEDTARFKIFDIVFKEPDVLFDQNIDILKIITDQVSIKNVWMEQRNIYLDILPPGDAVFVVKTNAILIEKAIEIILFKIFPLGKVNDLLKVSVSKTSIIISSGKNLPFSKAVEDMELELKFLEKVMDKSGLAFSINAKEIIIDRLC